MEVTHLSANELKEGLAHIRKSPSTKGTIDLIVARPNEGERIVLHEGNLDTVTGLQGDNWQTRGSRHTSDGSSDPDKQLNIMNSRVADLVAQSKDRWPLAGDQLFVDLDLSEQNLPAGSRLQIGEAVVEITPPPHLGCRKFIERFGKDAMIFVNSEEGKKLHLRGVCAKVVKNGKVIQGDSVTRI